MTEVRSHRLCWTGERYKHICREPSGRVCIEKGCEEPAGTGWGPYWCPDHDVERLDNISAGLRDIASALGIQEGGSE
jgi:hypothetical protein